MLASLLDCSCTGTFRNDESLLVEKCLRARFYINVGIGLRAGSESLADRIWPTGRQLPTPTVRIGPIRIT